MSIKPQRYLNYMVLLQIQLIIIWKLKYSLKFYMNINFIMNWIIIITFYYLLLNKKIKLTSLFHK